MDEMSAARVAGRTLGDEQRTQTGGHALDVDALAASVGVELAVFARDAKPGVMGYLDPDDDLIWLRDDLAPTVRRFTLAHELGHWRLHRARGTEAADCAPADVAHDFEQLDPDALLRPDEAYSPRSRRERQANAFAAELLAPLALVRAAFLGADGVPPRTVDAIAGDFAVSKAVIIGQLTQLLANPEATAEATAEVGQATASVRVDASQAVAAAAPTPTLVVAGPGTGKTSTLVARVRWLVAHGSAPGKILALTFSRKAAGELRDRISAALGATATDLPTVTTFHRFGADILRAYGHLVGLRPDFRLIDEISAFFVLRDLGSQLPLHHYASLAAPTHYFGDLLSAISAAKDELTDPARYRALAEAMTGDDPAPRERALEVAAVYAMYQDELARRGDADYGDLIRLTVRLFAEQPQVLAEVREQYPQLLVDEFQDINRANGVLLRQLAGPEGNIWAVGDANQAIYRFRGASSANIANFAHDYPTATITPLEYNYRSRPAVVAAANHFAAEALRDGTNAAQVALRPTRADAPDTLRLMIAPDGTSELADLVADIGRRGAAGTPWDAIAVLCRTRTLARQVATALAGADIPATTRVDLFGDEAVKDLLGSAHLLADEAGGLLRAARVPAHAFSRATVQQVLAHQQAGHLTLPQAIGAALDDPALAPAERAALAHLHRALGQMRHQPSITRALALYCFDLTGAARAHLLRDDGTAHHLAELLALAARYDQDRPVATGVDAERTAALRWEGFIAFLRAVRLLNRPGTPEAEHTSGAVQVLTIHGAKGLEWPIVYLPRLAGTYFPITRRADAAPRPPGLVAGADGDATAVHRTEEACLFYVAITRARDTLILSRAERYGKVRRAPSDFLAPLLRAGDVQPEVTSTTPMPAEADDAVFVPTARDPAFTEGEVLTSGAVQTYDRCPRQYAYRYGYHFASGRNTFWRLRRAVSAALRAANGDAGDAAGAVRAFETAWGHAVERDPFDALYLRHGRQAVAAAYDQVRANERSHDAFADAVEVTVAETLVRVELDRTEGATATDAGPRRVVRHQLGRRRASDEPTLGLYLTVLAQRTLSGDAGADTITDHHLNAGETVAVTLGPRQEERLRTQATAAIAGIHAGRFPARPEERKCAACEFALICPV